METSKFLIILCIFLSLHTQSTTAFSNWIEDMKQASEDENKIGNISLSPVSVTVWEGEPVHFLCTVNGQFPASADDVNVTWSVTSLNNRGFQTYISKSLFQVNSSLNFTQTQTNYTGNVSCSVESNNQIYEAIAKLNVVLKPSVDLTPEHTDVEKFENTVLKCYIRNMEQLNNIKVTWCRDGTVMTQLNNGSSKSKYSETVRPFPEGEELHLTSVTSNHSYSCGLENFTEPCAVTAQVQVFQRGVSMCQEDTDYKRTEWKSTVVGNTANRSCPEGYNGTVSRKCVEGSETVGKWQSPDYSKCVKTVFRTLFKKIKDNSADLNVSDILKEFSTAADSLKNNSLSGDILESSNILEKISHLTANKSITKNDTEVFVEVVSKMLDKDTSDTWKELYNETRETASSVMNSLTTFSKSAIKTLQENTSFVIEKENIVLKVSKEPIENIVFPDNKLNDSTFLHISKSALKKKLREDKPVDYSACLFKSLASILPSVHSDKTQKDIEINTPVLTIDFPSVSKITMDPPIYFIFQHIATNFTDPRCSFWEFDNSKHKGKWSSEGCEVTFYNNSLTNCSCNHLTNFAVLMSPVLTSKLNRKVLGIISMFGMSLSLISTTATVFAFIFLWRSIKSDKNCILLNICVALILAYVIFMAGIDNTQNKIACTSVAVMLHYFFLVVFFLMLSEAISLLISIVYVFATSSKLKYFLPLGWGAPLVIVAVSVAATQLNGYGTENHCWLTTQSGLLYAFVGPALGVIVANYVVVVLALKALYSTHAMMSKTRREKIKSGVRSISTLAPILGLTWVFGVFSINENLVVFQYLFAIFNSLQGFFIFLFHCLLNKSITDGFRHRWSGYKSSIVSSSTGLRKMKYSKSMSETDNTTQNTAGTILTECLAEKAFSDGSKGTVLTDSSPGTVLAESFAEHSFTDGSKGTVLTDSSPGILFTENLAENAFTDGSKGTVFTDSSPVAILNKCFGDTVITDSSKETVLPDK